jgi:hypothetical protein
LVGPIGWVKIKQLKFNRTDVVLNVGAILLTRIKSYFFAFISSLKPVYLLY